MTTTDQLLESILKRVNDSGVFFDITLTVGGSIVAGKVVPQSTWLAAVGRALTGSGEDMAVYAEDFTAASRAMSTEEFLHLADAKLIFGQQLPMPPSGGMMRFPVTAIDGWMVGRLAIEPAE